MKLAIVCCLHGTEKYGLEVMKRLLAPVPFFIANLEAVNKNVRFIDSDLNRSFPGKENGNHEERIAYKLMNGLSAFDYVIDLHSSSNYCPIFGIITKPDNEKIEFAKKLGLKKLVIMKESFASGKALIDFVKCGISIEVGPHKRKENVKEAIDLINNFINEKGKNKNTGQKSKDFSPVSSSPKQTSAFNPKYKSEGLDDIEIFEVIDIIKKEADCMTIKNFECVKKGDVIAFDENKKQYAEFDFIPILVNEDAYEGVLCLACKKVMFLGKRISKV